MADSPNPTESRVINQIAQDSGDETLALPEVQGEATPVYKVTGESKIPVSKHAGSLWKSRRDIANTKLEKSGKRANWEECIRYYKNDQTPGRKGSARRGRSDRTQGDTENIVFANTSALVPATYAKNPVAEVTPIPRDDNQPNGPDDELAQLAVVSERLVNALAGMQATPGINLKPKARKNVVMTTLTNLSYIEVGYTLRENSSQQALADLQRISEELTNAKDKQEIEEKEGELEALEETISFLRSSGPWIKFRHPTQVLRDPDALEPDLSDAKWVMISDFVSTAFINAKYREKVSDTEWKGIYQPSHVVELGNREVDEEINSFSLLGNKDDYRTYGYNDDETYRSACRTKVWYVWDKITRRVLMFNDKDWSWPIWVWDDPYGLDTFFPLQPLTFVTDPEDDIASSEVVYYLDQQDAINESNQERRKIRKRVVGTWAYNKNVVKDSRTIDAYISGTDVRGAVPVDAPPEADLTKLFAPLVPPSAQFLQLLDNQPYFTAIDRISSVMPVMRGQEFKTNTTNDAINAYNSQQQTRLDERIDAIEDFIGGVLWKVLQLCLQFMPQQEVAAIVGDRDAGIWRNMRPEEIQQGFSVSIVGGSSQKPTSQTKKQEATQIGQVLGQFANAGNGAAILLMIKLFERAYEDFTVSKEDWDFLIQSITQATQNSNPTGNPQQSGQQAGGQQDIKQILAQLPPQAQQAFQQAVAQGADPQAALQQIIQTLQSGGTA